MGLQRLLTNVLQYRKTIKPDMLKQFNAVRDDPHPQAVMVTCMDSRVLITRLLQTNVGDMLIVRNAGNLVPDADAVNYESPSTEVGALELGCVINNIRHVIVCGHSDCKAMNMLYGLRDSVDVRHGSPLQQWLRRHGAATAAKWEQLQEMDGIGPIQFQAETNQKTFMAYIDPENKFRMADKFSQVNTLQQMQHVASHPIIHDKLQTQKVRLSAFWFDVYTGDFYMFSRKEARFLEVNENTYNTLLIEDEL